MRTTAVICECNPVHAGHAYLFGQARCEDGCVLAVMSGSFTQRGEAALFDKYRRAEALLSCGVDLVAELPFPWSAAGAEDFARGGVTVAAGLTADALTFGSGCGDLSLLTRAADVRDSDDYAEAIRLAESERRGVGSAVLFDEAMARCGIMQPLEANDKLGLEYIRAGRRLGLTEFYPIRRLTDLPGAVQLRERILAAGEWPAEIPEAARAVYRTESPCRSERLNERLFAHARFGIAAEEENDRLRYAGKTARTARTPEDFMNALPTKKYTAARMRRELLFSLLGVTAEEIRQPPRFSILLAANERGRAWLGERRGKLTIPLITKPADLDTLDEGAIRQAETLRRADELYAYLTERPADWFVRQHPAMK